LQTEIQAITTHTNTLQCSHRSQACQLICIYIQTPDHVLDLSTHHQRSLKVILCVWSIICSWTLCGTQQSFVLSHWLSV